MRKGKQSYGNSKSDDRSDVSASARGIRAGRRDLGSERRGEGGGGRVDGRGGAGSLDGGDQIRQDAQAKGGPGHLTLILDVPPSLNNAFANRKKGGRVKSTAYRKWQTAAHWSVIAQASGSRLVRSPNRVTIALPVDMRGDIDNRIKAILDLLTLVRAITDDKHVVELVVRKSCVTKGKCVVLVETV